MTNQPKHTPGPWALEDGAPVYPYRITYGDGLEHGDVLASIHYNSDMATAKANAELIVRACNSHYALLEALESLIEYRDYLDVSSPLWTQTLPLVEAAIKKAKGE